MTTSGQHEGTAAERLASTIQRAAQAHERALLVQVWAVEYFERRGDLQAAQRHRDAWNREARFAEHCYGQLAELGARGADAPAATAAL